MQVSITQFRKDLFELVKLATAGEEVWVVHRGGRFKIAPEKTASRLSRITPFDLIETGRPSLEDNSWKEEVRLAWEKDWESL